jgi:hypothetical protein
MATPLCITHVVFLKNQTSNQTRVYLDVEIEPQLESKTLKIKSDWNQDLTGVKLNHQV